MPKHNNSKSIPGATLNALLTASKAFHFASLMFKFQYLFRKQNQKNRNTTLGGMLQKDNFDTTQ